MLRKYLLSLGVFALAFAILTISFLESASVKYAFATTTTPAPKALLKSSVDYQLPYPGAVLPGSPLWPLKAARDQIWYLITTNPAKQAELALLFADKRLGMSRVLFEEKKSELGFSTLTKAEKYLEKAAGLEGGARKLGMDTTNLLKNITLSSLKHRQVIEEILTIAPEDAKPGIIKVEGYSRDTYIKGRDGLNSKGIPSPINPFNGQ